STASDAAHASVATAATSSRPGADAAAWARQPDGMAWGERTTNGPVRRSDDDRVGIELEATVVDVWQHVPGEQVALGGVRVPGEDERLDPGVDQLVELAEHLVRVADDRRPGA